MKQLVLMFVILITFTACGSASTPVPTQDINATIEAISKSMIASTLTAQPTATNPPTNTPLPSETPTTLATQTTAPDLSLATATIDPSLGGVATATPWTGFFDPGNTDKLPIGTFRIDNLSGVKEIIVTLNGITLSKDQPVYYAYKVTKSLVIQVKWGNYDFVVQIPNKRFISGSFRISNDDKTTMTVFLTKVTVNGP